jgi:tetratricopeptide (TPR) repeat protein
MKFRNSHIVIILLFSCCVLNPLKTFASNGNYSDLDTANAAYNKANYIKAIAYYQKFLTGGIESAQAYYNMGNCYFRTNEMGKAILYYEKAEKLSPGDADIQFNLQLANQKITDKVSSDAPIFIYSDWKKFENKYTEKQWAIICISLLCLSLLLFALYLSAANILLRQISFWSGFAIIFFSLFTFYVAHQQYELLNSHDTAIVMTSTVTVNGAPEEKATQLFVIHEGTKVWVVKTEGLWTEIKLANGNQGWLISSDISAI